MAHFRVSILFILAMSLSGCVSTGVVPENYTGSTAVLADSSANLVNPKFGLLNPKLYVTPPKVDMFYAYRIDGKSIDTISSATYRRNEYRGFNMEVVPTERRVPVKPMTVDIGGSTYHAAPIGGIFGETYFVKGTVKFEPVPDQRYVVRGTLSKTYSAVWIESADGRRVTEKIEKHTPGES